MNNTKYSKLQFKVGVLFISAILMAILFAYFLGAFAGLGGGYSLNVHYNFVGGLQEGSPVRLAGVTVGKVQEISFFPTPKEFDGKEFLCFHAFKMP